LSDLLGGALIGVDLSRRMLEQAAAKGIYTALRRADLCTVLGEPGEAFALVTAADVFCYLGELREALSLCRARLAPDGLLIFSLERGDPGGGWRLGPEGRFSHAPDYVAACLAETGLAALEFQEEALRWDADHPVPGLMIAARAAAH